MPAQSADDADDEVDGDILTGSASLCTTSGTPLGLAVSTGFVSAWSADDADDEVDDDRLTTVAPLSITPETLLGFAASTFAPEGVACAAGMCAGGLGAALSN